MPVLRGARDQRRRARNGRHGPYGEAKAEAIIAAFERTGGILEQGPENIVFEDAAPELATRASGTSRTFAKNTPPASACWSRTFPNPIASGCAARRADAAIALEEYGEWIERSLPMMRGEPNVGLANMEWYFERVNFSPWNTEELLAMGEYEKNRFLMSLAVEKNSTRA